MTNTNLTYRFTNPEAWDDGDGYWDYNFLTYCVETGDTVHTSGITGYVETTFPDREGKKEVFKDDAGIYAAILEYEASLQKPEQCYVLFDGRHEVKGQPDMPTPQGALFESFDFETKTGIKTDLWESIDRTQNINVVATGLTPATLQVVNEFRGCQLTFWHYNRETDTYWAQPMF